MTFGFDTAVTIATEAIDRLTTTAESHNRVMVVEVMGRTKGWIAVMRGIAGGADAILVPGASRSTSRRCAPRSARVTSAAATSRSSSSRRACRRAPGGAGSSGQPAIDAFGFERLGGVGVRARRASSSS